MPLRISISPMSLSPVWEATAAWRRFVACVSAMPSHQARLLWQAALSEHPTHSINIPHKSSAVATELRYALLIHWYRPPLKNGGGTSGLKRTIIAGSGDCEASMLVRILRT